MKDRERKKEFRKKRKEIEKGNIWESYFTMSWMFSDAEAKALIKERQKKDNHNLSEFHLLFLKRLLSLVKLSFPPSP